ncbi:MAG: winged helix-turn-helix transcriptional regulator [Thermoplasmatota archaeon]
MGESRVMRRASIVASLIVVLAAGTARASDQAASAADVILSLCPDVATIDGGGTGLFVGEAYDAGDARVSIELQARLAYAPVSGNASDANFSASDGPIAAGWHASATASNTLLAPRASTAIQLHLDAPQRDASAATHGVVAWLTLGGALQTGAVPVVVRVRWDSNATGGSARADSSTCARGNTTLPAFVPPPRASIGAASRSISGAPLLVAGTALVGGGIVAGSAIVVAASEDRRLRWFGPALALYSRLARSQVLDHATRERILSAVRTTPGIHFTDLARALRLRASVLDHHLRMLERHGLVRWRREGRFRSYYLLDARIPPPPEPPLSPMARAILDALATRSEFGFGELAERLGASKSGLSYALRQLRERGLAELVLADDGRWVVRARRRPGP